MRRRSLLSAAGGRLQHKKTIKEMEEKLDKILMYSLLAAKNVLNIDDVAVLTGLSKSTLYKMTCTKEIPFYRPNGKLIYFDRKEVESWMKRNRVAGNFELEEGAADFLAGIKKGGKER